MRLIGDIALDAEVRAIASGAITDGAPVIVNSAGTVSVVATESASTTIGTPQVFESAFVTVFATTFDSNSNRVVIAYQDGGNSSYGTAIVGTVDSSDNSISFGTAVVFESADTRELAVTFDSNSNRVVIAYQDTGNSYNGTAIVGTVDPSDNSISFGSAVVFESASTDFIATTFDSNSNKVVIAYEDVGNSSHGTAIVGTVSGTSISFGSAAVYESAESTFNSIAFDSNSNKVVIAYKDHGNALYGTAIVGTVSGTSISFGTAVVFESAEVDDVSIAFDSNVKKVVIAYEDNGNSNYGTAVEGTVSGTSISFATPVVFESARGERTSNTFDSTAQRVIIAYRDTGNSSYGTSVVFRTSGDYGNLTTTNYIGFANAAYADGQKATVKTTGSISRNIPQIASASSTVGTEVVYGSAGVNYYTGATFDSSNNRVVIVYRDGANSNYGTAVVGNVSGTSISFGTPVTYNTSGTTDPNAVGFDSNSNKVVIAYRDGGDSDKGKAIVGTVDPSDNSITFGSEVEFNGGNTGYPNVVFDSSNNKIVIVYTDYGNSSYGAAIVGTVSGTSISFGSEVVFESAASYYTAATFDSSNNKIVVAYSDDGNSGHGTAIVGTVSGTSISFGTPAVFNTASTTSGFGPSPLGIAFDSTNNKVVIAYADGGDSSHGYAIVGTVSGTDISFGSETEFENAVIYGLSAVFDTSSNKIVISYTDETNSYYGTFTLGTVSSTSISFETAAVFASATTQYIASTFDTNSNRVVTAYADTQGPTANNGTAIVIRPAGQGEDLTIGQQYFVQTDGTLGTSADDPSVIAGTAIGTSDIIVKG